MLPFNELGIERNPPWSVIHPVVIPTKVSHLTRIELIPHESLEFTIKVVALSDAESEGGRVSTVTLNVVFPLKYPASSCARVVIVPLKFEGTPIDPFTSIQLPDEFSIST
jgi:hypothetical protein